MQTGLARHTRTGDRPNRRHLLITVASYNSTTSQCLDKEGATLSLLLRAVTSLILEKKVNQPKSASILLVSRLVRNGNKDDATDEAQGIDHFSDANAYKRNWTKKELSEEEVIYNKRKVEHPALVLNTTRPNFAHTECATSKESVPSCQQAAVQEKLHLNFTRLTG
ncbi:hypothetical protein M514_03508, partial [Trichuris suis]